MQYFKFYKSLNLTILVSFLVVGVLTPKANAAMEVKLNGYGETYYQFNMNTPTNGGVGETGYRLYDTEHNSFDVNFAELGVRASADNIKLAIDFSWGPMADTINGIDSDRNITQAYIRLPATAGRDFAIDIGKFHGHLGYETIRAKENFNFSRGYNFSFGTPTVETGVRVKGKTASDIVWGAYVYNGNSGNFTDNNDSKSLGGSLTFKPGANVEMTYGFKLGSEGSISQPANNEKDTTMIHNVNAQFNMSDKMTLAADVVLGEREDDAEKDDEWMGLGVYLKYSLSSESYIAGRFEMFQDDDGDILNPTAGANTPDSEDVTGLTVTYGYLLNSNADLRFEFRHDSSDNDGAFAEDFGGATDSQTTILAGLLINI